MGGAPVARAFRDRARLSMTISAEVNGEQRTLSPGTTVEDVVLLFVAHLQGYAVARNGEVVPRSTWAKVEIEGGDRIEVLGAVPGG